MQILDRKTIAIPGPSADASPELIAAAEARAASVATETAEEVVLPAILTNLGNPETAASQGFSDLVENLLRTGVRNQTLDWDGARTNPNASRPVWGGRVRWWVNVGSALPVNLQDGDIVVRVAVEPLPWSPLQLPNVQAWWSAAGLADGSAVSSLPDLTGSGRALKSHLGTVTVDADGLGGKQALIFNGVSSLKGDFPDALGAGTVCAWWVARSSNVYPGGQSGFFFDSIPEAGATGSQFRAYREASSTGQGFAAVWGSDSAASRKTTSDSNPHVFLFVGKQSGSSELWIDGTLVGAAADNGMARLAGLHVGARVDEQRFLNGAIGELFFSIGTPTEGDRAKAFAYLADKGGIKL